MCLAIWLWVPDSPVSLAHFTACSFLFQGFCWCFLPLPIPFFLVCLPHMYTKKKLLQFRFLSFFYTHGPPLPRDFLTLLSITLTFLPQFYVEVSWVVAWNQIRKWESDMYVQFLYFVTLIKFLKFTFYLLIQKLVVTISTYIIVERIRWNDRCELPTSVSCI